MSEMTDDEFNDLIDVLAEAVEDARDIEGINYIQVLHDLEKRGYKIVKIEEPTNG